MSSEKLVIIGVYVDDIILAGKNTEKINEVKIALSQEFQVKDKPSKTPESMNSKLVNASENSELEDQEQYKSTVGSLLYLSTRIRPDIAFAVSNVARYCSKPTKEHWI